MMSTHALLPAIYFTEELSNKIDEITEKEMKIIMAFNDLLPEQLEHDGDFVANSLSFLKTHYGLTKSVWKVLLKLYDDIEDFSSKLSNWELLRYDYYNEDNLCTMSPVEQYGLSDTIREYNIKKLFLIINEMSKCFSIDEVCNYLGIFIEEFDNKKYAGSITNIRKLIKTTQAEGMELYNIQSFSCFFCHAFYKLSRIYPTLRSMHFSKMSNEKNAPNVPNLTYQLGYLNIETKDALHTFNTIINSYLKYTNEEFITYKGMMEIKEKEIDDQDKMYIQCLIQEFNKTEKRNQIELQVLIEMMKLLKKYDNDIVKAIDKISLLTDYFRTDDFLDKKNNHAIFTLNNILAWNNAWHNQDKKDHTKEEKEIFKNYNIDISSEKYYFKQIKDSHELYNEGKIQNHCVFSYKKNCVEGNTIIVSMQDHHGKIISTIRLGQSFNILRLPQYFKIFSNKKKNWAILENRKKSNAACSEEEKIAAKQYFETIKNRLP